MNFKNNNNKKENLSGDNEGRQGVRLVKGTRTLSIVFSLLATFIVTNIALFAANTYYNLDTGEIVVENAQRVDALVRATNGIIVGGTSTQGLSGTNVFEVVGSGPVVATFGGQVVGHPATADNQFVTLAQLQGPGGDGSGLLHDPVTLAGTYDYLTLSGQEITLNQIDLTTDVTGTLSVGLGGTGATSFTAGQLLVGNGTGALATASGLSWSSGTLTVGNIAIEGALIDGEEESGSSGQILSSTGSGVEWIDAGDMGLGSVTSVNASGGSTGLTFLGGPVTTTGTLTLGGTLNIANGGTGAATASAALANLGGVSTSRNISAGTGLTGGGDLTADRTLSVNFGTTAGTVAEGNDQRIVRGNSAWGWGDHALGGYLDGTTELGDLSDVVLSSLGNNHTLVWDATEEEWVNRELTAGDIGGIGVETLNGLSGTLSIVGNSMISVSPSGSNINLSLSDNSITNAKLQNNSITINSSDGSITGVGTVALGGSLNLSVNTGDLAGDFFRHEGNAFGETAILGTTDNNPLEFITNDTTRMTIGSTGNITMGGNLTVTGNFDMSGLTIVTSGSTTTIATKSNRDLVLNAGTGEIVAQSSIVTSGGYDITSGAILREVLPIFGYDVPVRGSDASFDGDTPITKAISHENLPALPAGATREYVFTIHYTGPESTWHVHDGDESITSFIVDESDSPTNHDGTATIYTTGAINVPTGDAWTLRPEIESGELQVNQVFLGVYDRIN